jgi:preprotein translocase SecE subunit
MSAVIDDKNEKAMATSNVIASGAEEPDDDKPSRREEPLVKAPPPGGRGFFTIYKRGQGYWTRMGTILGAALIGIFTVNFIYAQLPVWLPEAWNVGKGLTQTKKVTLGVCAAFIALYSLLVYWLVNKPTNVDFLIATDSEMKKVNWTSRKELIGSTKVVIIFMFLIAAILFLIDLFFGYVFYLFGVLKTKPF